MKYEKMSKRNTFTGAIKALEITGNEWMDIISSK